MGVGNLPGIVAQLIRHGQPAETPAAVIQWGTKPEQRTVTGTLGTIVSLAEARAVGPPAVLVVGEVVRLRERLQWFERRPLFGRRIVITRAADQAADFADALEAQGAEVLQIPLIAFAPPGSWEPLDQALARLDQYRWVIFTSANGVEAFFRRLRASGRDARVLGAVRICAIGPATAEALERHAIVPDLVPAVYQAEGVIEALEAQPLEGARILVPRAEVARDLLPLELERRGARVDVVPVYRTVRAVSDAALLRQLLQDRKIDLLTFTSSSTVTSFVEGCGATDLKALLDGVKIACIGPITARTAEQLGLTVDITPPQYTIPALVTAIVDYYTASSGCGA
jgi:uroporphyrinogen III methyltransferase/synthase